MRTAIVKLADLRTYLNHARHDEGPEVVVTECYAGIGIQTAAGIYGVCERDGRLCVTEPETGAEGDPMTGTVFGPATVPPPADPALLGVANQVLVARLAAAEKEKDEARADLAAVHADLQRIAMECRDAFAESARRYDCHGGPGTTEPACGACATCLTRERDAAIARAERVEAVVTSIRQMRRASNTEPEKSCLRRLERRLLRAMESADRAGGGGR